MDRELDASFKKERLRRRVGYTAGSLVLATAVLILLPGWLRPTLARERIRTGVVDRGPIEAVVEASGLVIPAFEGILSSPVEARVEKILKRPGETVAAGEEILRLDTSALEVELGRLEDQLLKKANEQAQLRLQLEKNVTALRGQIAAARLDREAFGERATQNRTLRGEGLVSEQVARAAEVEAQKARIAVEQLEAQSAGEGRSTDVALAGVEIDLAILRRDRDEARRQLELATTRAPSSGVLTWVLPQEGVTLRKGEVIARIADLEAFRVEAKVSDVHASRLRAGEAARVMVDGEALGGRLAQVLPTIESGTLKFVVELDDPRHAKLRNNLSVDVLVVYETRPDVLRAPRGPYASGGLVQPVFVVDAGNGRSALRRSVRFGLAGRDRFEVLDGLAAGDEVIVSDMSEQIHLSRINLK